jgi:hypothetical protein
MTYDPNRLNNTSNKSAEVDNKDKRNSLGRWLGGKATPLTLVGIMGFSSLLGGCGDGEANNVVKPAEPGANYEYHEIQKGIPICISVTEMGEKKFIEKYGASYTDPEFAFKALYRYENSHDGESIFINPDYINLYNSSLNSEEILSNDYDLGFDTFKMPLDTLVDKAYSEKMFNEYATKTMNRCMNLLSCNPSAKNLIRDEFMSLYPENNPLDEHSKSEREGKWLFEALENIVDNHNEYCEYSIEETWKPDFPEDDIVSHFTEPEPIDGNSQKGFEVTGTINLLVTDHSVLDEDGIPAYIGEKINTTMSFRRIPVSQASDNSIKFSENSVIGIH